MAKTSLPYTPEELYMMGEQRAFTGRSLSEIAFPLGGIGAGTISLGGRGNLRDFEIFGRPAKGNVLPFTFFALWARAEGDAPVARILEGKIPPPYRSGFGEPQNQLQGVARFADAAFTGCYPRATLDLSDPDVPVSARLDAWNPFIPLNVHDSALPASIFEWTFTNPTDRPVEVSLAASAVNPVTAKGADGAYTGAGSLNAYQAVGRLKGILFTHPGGAEADPATGTLSLTTTWDSLDVQTHWFAGGGFWDRCHLFWDQFAATGRLTSVLDSVPGVHMGEVGSLVLRATIPAGGSVTMPVFYTWLFPRMLNPWGTKLGNCFTGDTELPNETLETYAGARFADAWAVASYTSSNLGRLRDETELWRTRIMESTLPAHVIDAVTSQASIVRTCTCFLLADGTFLGWEGCGDQFGCCHGNCTHVWNYEQAVAFLFPELERNMRETEFLHNMHESGSMGFRTHIPPGSQILEFKPCADGQMGVVMQVYRDWQLSGDDEFLRRLWPNVKRALEYAWSVTPESAIAHDSVWDADKDGVIEGEQHNTYDIEFFGPNTLCTAMYLGALRACEEMARYLGESEKAEEYRSIYESGRKKVDAELWNGDYYFQNVNVIDGVRLAEHLKTPDAPPVCACKQSPGGKVPALAPGKPTPKYQYGEGCLSDQLLGQVNAHIFGLGYILDPEHVRTAVKSIFDSNFRAPIDAMDNVQRVYALNDEAGLLLCSWPHGNRPVLPFVYSDEVWTGIEYQVAAHLIYEGWVDEGLAVVKAIRDRYAGYNRNPWNEVECGHHYARAMASWGVKLALDGFTFSLPERRIGFAPRINASDFRTVWTTSAGWGAYSQNTKDGRFELTVLSGSLPLRRLELGDLGSGKVSVVGPSGDLSAQVEGRSVVLENEVTLMAGQALTVTRA